MAVKEYRRSRKRKHKTRRHPRRHRGGSAAAAAAEEIWPHYRNMSTVNADQAFLTGEHPPYDVHFDRKLNVVRNAFRELQYHPPNDVTEKIDRLVRNARVLRDAILLIAAQFGYPREMNVAASPLKNEWKKVNELIGAMMFFRSAPHSIAPESPSMMDRVRTFFGKDPNRTSPIPLERNINLNQLSV